MAVLLRTSAGTTLKSGGGPVSDSDAQAFITAVIAGGGALSTIERKAINDLVIGFKANGTWAKKIAVYPFVGATANEHKWNLKDPRDLNAARRLIFTGAWVHTAQGIAGNAVDTAAETFISMDEATASLTGDIYLALWSRTNAANDNWGDIGVVNLGDSGSYVLQIRVNIANTAMYFQWTTPNNAPVYMDMTTSVGFSSAGVGGMNANELVIYKNGIKQAWRTATMTHEVHPESIFIGACGVVGGPPIIFTGRQYSYAEVSHAHTDANVAADYATILAFQTTLTRQNPPAFLAVTLAVFAFLMSQGISLTHQQQLDLDILLGETPAPAPALSKTGKKKKEKPMSWDTIPPAVMEYLRAEGHDV